jgi:hypothetical protein
MKASALQRPALRLALGLLLALGSTAMVSGQVVRPRNDAPVEITDRRSHELVRRDCRSEIGRNELTLFANGTVRHRYGPPDALEMTLLEIPPDEVEGFTRRLSQEDLSETDHRSRTAGGDWIEVCTLTLRLPGLPEETLTYGSFDSRSLALSRVTAVTDELEARARAESSRSHLPIGYVPRRGDILLRFDGFRYRVVGYTKFKRGIEVIGLEQPMTLFVAVEELDKEFSELVSRRGSSP